MPHESDSGAPTLAPLRDVDRWNVDNYLAHVIANALREFEESEVGYPHGQTEQSWPVTLKEMREGFEQYAATECHHERVDQAAIDRSLELFAEYFRALWS